MIFRRAKVGGVLCSRWVKQLLSRGQEVLQQTGASLLGHVHLIFQISPVGDFGVFNLPTQVLDFGLQLSLLALELER